MRIGKPVFYHKTKKAPTQRDYELSGAIMMTDNEVNLSFIRENRITGEYRELWGFRKGKNVVDARV